MNNYKVTFKLDMGRTELLATTDIDERSATEAVATVRYWMSEDYTLDEEEMNEMMTLVSVELAK